MGTSQSHARPSSNTSFSFFVLKPQSLTGCTRGCSEGNGFVVVRPVFASFFRASAITSLRLTCHELSAEDHLVLTLDDVTHLRMVDRFLPVSSEAWSGVSHSSSSLALRSAFASLGRSTSSSPSTSVVGSVRFSTPGPISLARLRYVDPISSLMPATRHLRPW